MKVALCILLLNAIAFSQSDLRVIYATGFTPSFANGAWYGNNTPDGCDGATYGGYDVNNQTGAGGQPSILRTGHYAICHAGITLSDGSYHNSASRSLGIARTIYYCGKIYFQSTNSPTSNVEMMTIGDGVAIYMGFMWRADGKWSLTDRGSVKSTSTNAIPLNQWLDFELYSTCKSSSNTNRIKLNGETLSDTVRYTGGATNFGIGWGFLGTLPGNLSGQNAFVFYDDLVVYDTLGSQYTVPDTSVRIYYSFPTSDSSIAGWRGGGGGSSNIWGGVDNFFPKGTNLTEVDSTNIKNSTSSTSDKYFFTIPSLVTSGYSGLHVRALFMGVRHGEHAAAGSISGRFSFYTNPTNTSTSITFGNHLGAHVLDGNHANSTEKWITTLCTPMLEPVISTSSTTTLLLERITTSTDQACVDQIWVMLITGMPLAGTSGFISVSEE